MVESVDKTLNFYTQILGFEQVMVYPEDGDTEWGMVSYGSVGLMFKRKKEFIEDISELSYSTLGGTFSLYIDVENVEQLYEGIRDKTLVVKYLHDTFYNTREFTIKDNNAYFIVFAQRLND